MGYHHIFHDLEGRASFRCRLDPMLREEVLMTAPEAPVFGLKAGVFGNMFGKLCLEIYVWTYMFGKMFGHM